MDPFTTLGIARSFDVDLDAVRALPGVVEVVRDGTFLGVIALREEQSVAAADLLLQAIELAPGFASAWFTLGQIREQLDEVEAAIAAYRKAGEADPDDRHGASLRLMRLGAEKLSAMPQA